MEESTEGYVSLLPERCRTAVEIGTWDGRWASRFMEQVPDCRLFCVDPWSCDGMPEDVGKDPSSFRDWMRKMRPWFADRVWPIRGLSWDVAKWFSLELDFVMIDGDHREESLYRDLCDWWPKLRPGGLLMGHDWTCRRWARDVQLAVNRWARERRLRVETGQMVKGRNGTFWCYRGGAR